MGAGTGGKKTAVFYQLHAPDIDFPVALHCIFNGITGLGKGGRVQNNHIKFLALFFQSRQEIKHIRTDEADLVLQSV